MYACIVINHYHCKYFKLFIIIYPTCFRTMEPEDEELCKAVPIFKNTYIKTLDVILKQLSNTLTTALHNMGVHLGF